MRMLRKNYKKSRKLLKKHFQVICQIWLKGCPLEQQNAILN
jgi:hypothetical protein